MEVLCGRLPGLKYQDLIGQCVRGLNWSLFILDTVFVSISQAILTWCNPTKIFDIVVRPIAINMVDPSLCAIFRLGQKCLCHKAVDMLGNNNALITVIGSKLHNMTVCISANSSFVANGITRKVADRFPLLH